MDVESATAEPRTPLSCTVTARGHTMVQDKPAEFGGTDDGPMASEFLLASLLACQLSTFAKVAAKRRKDIAPQSIRGDLHFNDAGDISHVDVYWSFDTDMDASALETLVRLTDRACTISKALDVPVHAHI